MVVYMYSGQRRSAGSAQVSGEQVPEMDGSMALMATEEGAGTGEVVALMVQKVPYTEVRYEYAMEYSYEYT